MEFRSIHSVLLFTLLQLIIIHTGIKASAIMGIVQEVSDILLKLSAIQLAATFAGLAVRRLSAAPWEPHSQTIGHNKTNVACMH
jgi:hypothetical protein